MYNRERKSNRLEVMGIIMNKVNDSSVVKRQYATENNLSTRISIHDKYSTNKIGFGNWIVSNYRIEKGAKVLGNL